MSIRLNKYIQENFGISRRKFVELVKNSRVFLNGDLVESFGVVVNNGDILEIKGLLKSKEVNIDNRAIELIMFNKPVGYVCSKSDKNNKTIYEILPKKFSNYFYVGRLDKNSRGLLLLTNDSNTVHNLQHPSKNIKKTYIVTLNRVLLDCDIRKIKSGVYSLGEKLNIEDIHTQEGKDNNSVKIVLIEGRKRHIRRIFNELSYKILDLVRIKEGQFELGDLNEGDYSILNLT